MLRFNNCFFGRRDRGNATGGFGTRRRDGSCQGQGLGQENRMGQSQNASGPGFFNRFFAGGNLPNRTSSTLGTEGLLSAIKDLQQQIDDLKNQSGK